MPTHLYCLLPAGSNATPPDSPPIRVLTIERIVAWVGDTDSLRLSRDIRQAARATLDHDRVVSAAVAQGITPIPASLGDAYETDASASDDIAAHANQVLAAFDDIGDRVEMTVIIGLADAPPTAQAEGRGRAYLEQLRSLPSRAAAIADRIERALEPVGGIARRRGDGGRVGLSHLIPRTRMTEYRQAALTMAGTGYRIVIDGPRAPYSFASFSRGNGIVTRRTVATA